MKSDWTSTEWFQWQSKHDSWIVIDCRNLLSVIIQLKATTGRAKSPTNTFIRFICWSIWNYKYDLLNIQRQYNLLLSVNKSILIPSMSLFKGHLYKYNVKNIILYKQMTNLNVFLLSMILVSSLFHMPDILHIHHLNLLMFVQDVSVAYELDCERRRARWLDEWWT